MSDLLLPTTTILKPRTRAQVLATELLSLVEAIEETTDLIFELRGERAAEVDPVAQLDLVEEVGCAEGRLAEDAISVARCARQLSMERFGRITSETEEIALFAELAGLDVAAHGLHDRQGNGYEDNA
jgi:hypothetical protein